MLEQGAMEKLMECRYLIGGRNHALLTNNYLTKSLPQRILAQVFSRNFHIELVLAKVFFRYSTIPKE